MQTESRFSQQGLQTRQPHVLQGGMAGLCFLSTKIQWRSLRLQKFFRRKKVRSFTSHPLVLLLSPEGNSKTGRRGGVGGEVQLRGGKVEVGGKGGWRWGQAALLPFSFFPQSISSVSEASLSPDRSCGHPLTLSSPQISITEFQRGGIGALVPSFTGFSGKLHPRLSEKFKQHFLIVLKKKKIKLHSLCYNHNSALRRSLTPSW